MSEKKMSSSRDANAIANAIPTALVGAPLVAGTFLGAKAGFDALDETIREAQQADDRLWQARADTQRAIEGQKNKPSK